MDWNEPITAQIQHSYYDPWGRRVDGAPETVSGTKDQVFERFYDTNSRLRYSGGSYAFLDAAVDAQYRHWRQSIPTSRSMAIYYGSGTVD